jgi:hypothetical protein
VSMDAVTRGPTKATCSSQPRYAFFFMFSLKSLFPHSKFFFSKLFVLYLHSFSFHIVTTKHFRRKMIFFRCNNVLVFWFGVREQSIA